jgi:hypothetical protein
MLEDCIRLYTILEDCIRLYKWLLHTPLYNTRRLPTPLQVATAYASIQLEDCIRLYNWLLHTPLYNTRRLHTPLYNTRRLPSGILFSSCLQAYAVFLASSGLVRSIAAN